MDSVFAGQWNRTATGLRRSTRKSVLIGVLAFSQYISPGYPVEAPSNDFGTFGSLSPEVSYEVFQDGERLGELLHPTNSMGRLVVPLPSGQTRIAIGAGPMSPDPNEVPGPDPDPENVFPDFDGDRMVRSPDLFRFLRGWEWKDKLFDLKRRF